MDTTKTYQFNQNGVNQFINFSLTANGTINSEKYSLLDVMADDRLKFLTLQERMEILSSYTEDTKAGKHYSYRRELLSGAKTK
mgnify:CR=1 FL=1